MTSGRRAFAAMILALAFATAGSAATPESAYVAAHGFSFALLGGVPAGDREEMAVARVLTQIGNETDLAIHVGNIRGDKERCDDAVFDRRRALLAHSPVPLVFTPGNRDWVDCERESAGRYSSVERLNRLRDLFFDSPQSFGMITLDLQRQSGTAKYRGYAENARWEYGNILFSTFNMPAGHNNFRRGAGRNGEYEDRIVANAFWLGQAFATATRLKAAGIVLAFQADLHFGGDNQDLDASEGRDPYGDFKALLARLAAKFPGQVLLVHGAGTPGLEPARPDHPLRIKGKTLANVTRVQTYGSPLALHWLKVTVTPGRKKEFRIESRNVIPEPPQP